VLRNAHERVGEREKEMARSPACRMEAEMALFAGLKSADHGGSGVLFSNAASRSRAGMERNGGRGCGSGSGALQMRPRRAGGGERGGGGVGAGMRPAVPSLPCPLREVGDDADGWGRLVSE